MTSFYQGHFMACQGLSLSLQVYLSKGNLLSIFVQQFALSIPCITLDLLQFNGFMHANWRGQELGAWRPDC